LCVEEQFYLFWPLLLLVSGKYLKQSIYGLIIIGMGIRAYYYFFDLHNYDMFNYRMTPACLDVLGMGALLAYFKSYKEEAVRKYLKYWWIPLVAAIIYCVNALVIANPFIYQVLNRTLVGIFSVSLIGWAVY